MDTQFATVDPPDSPRPGNQRHHVVLVGEASSNTDLMADTLSGDCSVELAESCADVDCVCSAPSLVSVAVVDATSATEGVRDLVTRLRDHGIPVLLLTSSVTAPLRRYAAERRAFEVLEKPIRRSDLRGGVRRLSRN
jgi:DNA-binding NtrC family response regulator